MSAVKKRQWTAEELTHPKLGDLPSEWKWSTIGDEITELKGGLGTKKSDYIESGILLFNKGNVTTDGRTSFDGKRKYVSADFFAEHKKHAVEPGDLVVTLRDLSVKADFLGLVGTYRQTEPALLSQGACVVETGANLLPPFLAYYSNSPFYRTTAKTNKNGTTQVHLRNGQFGAIPIPIPPLPEQRRIVARIEELFSRLDAGVAALRHAKAQLHRYRQSVLAAAVTGQLTQAWREQHPDTEPASELLERILIQKREQWDGKRRYKEPPAPVTDALPKLPASWTWATVVQQAAPDERAITDGPFGSKLKSSHYTDSGPRVLRLQNIGDGVFKDEYAHIPDDHFQTLRNHEIFAGDLVIRALGIPAHQACIVPPSVGPAIVKADCIRFKVFEPHINPRFTLFALNSHPVRSRSERHIHGVGRPRLNGTEIKSIALPLAPLAEQHQIVAGVEARTTAIDQLEAELDRQITRSNRFRQSTLAAAFSGQLS